MRNLPEWLRAAPDSTAFETAPVPRGRRRFVRRALVRFAGFLADPLLGESGPERTGFFQRMDPRAKVLGFLGLIVTTTLLSKGWALGLDAALCLSLALAAQVPARRLAGAWVAVPLFSALVMVPATLNLITPGDVVAPLWHPGCAKLGPWAMPSVVGITASGIEVAGRFAARSLLCVTLALLMASTARPDRLCRGLRALGVPRAFVMLLTMMERYLDVLVRAAEEIHMAKVSRTIAPGSLRQEQAWVASGVGSLFRRSRALGNAVYLAMLSRGFTGEVRLLEEGRWRLSDGLFLASSAAACAALVLVEKIA